MTGKNKSNRGPKGWAEKDRLREGLITWGIRLAKKRRSLGLTQAEMAEILGISQPGMCNLEKGTYRPSEELKALVEKKFFKHAGDSGKKRAPRP